MAIYDVMLGKTPSDECLIESISAHFDAEPGAVMFLGALVGAQEGQVKEAVMVDRRELSGDFTVSLSIASRRATTEDALARHFADTLAVPALCVAPGEPNRFLLFDPEGGSRKVRLVEGDDPGIVRVA